MDPVTIESDRGITEQQQGGRGNRLTPPGFSNRLVQRQPWCGRGLVDNVLFLAQAQRIILPVLMLHCDEQQLAGATIFSLTALMRDSRCADCPMVGG